MSKTPLFTGSCTALITPYTEHGIDYERLGANLEYQYENGTAAVVICGTTGENATHSQEEHDELVRFTVNRVSGRMKVIAGIGSNNTIHALKNAENAASVGADGILMVTPYYNKASQKGLVAHFTHVADRVALPMILYNVPSRTGIGIAPETYRALSEHPNINGVKEAAGDLTLVSRIRSLCGDELNIWSGNDSDTVPMMALGAKGVISVASNLLPAVVAKLCKLCADGDFPGATALYCRYCELFHALFLEPNPIPVKAAMKLTGQDSGLLRLPLTELGEDNQNILRARMRELGIIS